MFLEEWSEIKAKNKLRCPAEAEPKYYFLRAKTPNTFIWGSNWLWSV